MIFICQTSFFFQKHIPTDIKKYIQTQEQMQNHRAYKLGIYFIL